LRVIEAPSPCLSDGAFISLDFSHLSIYQNVGHDLGSQAKGINKGLYKVKLKEEITLTFTVLPNIDIEVYPMKT
jgi:hypothetical protein